MRVICGGGGSGEGGAEVVFWSTGHLSPAVLNSGDPRHMGQTGTILHSSQFCILNSHGVAHWGQDTADTAFAHVWLSVSCGFKSAAAEKKKIFSRMANFVGSRQAVTVQRRFLEGCQQNNSEASSCACAPICFPQGSTSRAGLRMSNSESLIIANSLIIIRAPLHEDNLALPLMLFCWWGDPSQDCRQLHCKNQVAFFRWWKRERNRKSKRKSKSERVKEGERKKKQIKREREKEKEGLELFLAKYDPIIMSSLCVPSIREGTVCNVTHAVSTT